jgi:DNA polymerase III epsilon subunit-like protein
MKYFIDFEATQFSEEIISIGCIREDGETFYSLVSPVDGKITPFITNLTGITKEMVDGAMSPEQVFENFYDWVFEKEDVPPEFYCWGNSDAHFISQTFKRTNSIKARLILGYICGGLHDYCAQFSKRYKFRATLKLIKVYNIFVPGAEQTHNALDDAVMLYRIYCEANNHTISEMKEILKNAFPNAATMEKTYNDKGQPLSPDGKLLRWHQMGYPNGTICIVDEQKIAIYHFTDKTQAAEWLFNKKGLDKIKISRKELENGIEGAAKGGRRYYGYKWLRVWETIKEEGEQNNDVLL